MGGSVGAWCAVTTVEPDLVGGRLRSAGGLSVNYPKPPKSPSRDRAVTTADRRHIIIKMLASGGLLVNYPNSPNSPNLLF